MADSFVKKAYGEAQEQVDAQSILDKYNAATAAQFNVQREKNRQAENQFYNQMYNTQRTAMDTIRQANAAAVSSGASRGVQAANELSALLGLEQESVASATELAQANRQTAQEETAAVLENVLNAYQQEQQEKSQYVQQTIEAASLDSNSADATTNKARYYTEALETGVDSYLDALAKTNANYTTGSEEGEVALSTALGALELPTEKDFPDAVGRFFGGRKYSEALSSKINSFNSTIESIIKQFGLEDNQAKYQQQLNKIKEVITKADEEDNAQTARSVTGNNSTVWDRRAIVAEATKILYQNLLNDLRTDYAKKLNKTE